jgi:universal stress protein A
MVPWLEIVCAVDFSTCSRAALERAAELARRFDARLTLVHVWTDPLVSGAAVGLPVPPSLAEDQEKELGGKLEGWREEAGRLAGRDVAARLESGAPVAEIARVAREQHADLVVIGTHGRTGVKRALLGSVAEGVVRHAPCAVLVARDVPDED